MSEKINERNAVDTIHKDFQKPLNKVPHKRPVNILKFCGITASVPARLRNWLKFTKPEYSTKNVFLGLEDGRLWCFSEVSARTIVLSCTIMTNGPCSARCSEIEYLGAYRHKIFGDGDGKSC